MPLTRSLSALTRHRIGLIWAAVVLLVIAIGPALISRFTSNVGLLALNRSLAQYGMSSDTGRDDPNLAVAERWLKAATELDVSNLGAWRGLGFALAAYGKKDKAGAALKTAGATALEFIGRGDEAFKAQQYGKAIVWYERAVVLTPDSFDLIFRSAIAAALAGNAKAPALLNAVRERDSAFEVYTLKDTLRIEGAKFRWMTPISTDVTYGTPLSYPTNGDLGFFWWSGEALVVLSAEQDGRYLLRMPVRHSNPPPVEMAIGVDGQHLQRLSLERGDNSWQTIVVPLDLRRGWHTIHIWFLNNEVVSGKDRDAVVAWVELQEHRP